jgi:hypothetical protein
MFKRKHRFSLFKSPRYQESFDFKDDKKIFTALALRVARKLGWSKVYSESNKLIFRSKEKWASHAEITIEFIGLPNISIQSETILDQRWDLGKNFARVQEFKKLIFNDLESITEVDKRNIHNTEEPLLEFYDYKEPKIFDAQMGREAPNKFYINVYIGIIILFLGAVFAYLKYLDLFVAFTREMIFSISLWFAIYFGAKQGNMHSYSELKRMALLAVILFYVLQVLMYHSLIIVNAPDTIDLTEYAGQQLSIAAVETFDRVGQKIIFISFLVGLISYFFFSNLKLSISKLKKKEIPDEILAYTEYLVAKGESNYQIKKNLTNKGITDHQLHSQILEVLRYQEGTIS